MTTDTDISDEQNIHLSPEDIAEDITLIEREIMAQYWGACTRLHLTDARVSGLMEAYGEAYASRVLARNRAGLADWRGMLDRLRRDLHANGLPSVEAWVILDKEEHHYRETQASVRAQDAALAQVIESRSARRFRKR